jgi:hypothetical protein
MLERARTADKDVNVLSRNNQLANYNPNMVQHFVTQA